MTTEPSNEPVNLDRLNKEACQEILNEARSLISAQAEFMKNIAANMTTIVTLSSTLVIAAFGAVAFATPTSHAPKPWLPVWGAIGFAVSGLFWILAAIAAADGFAPRGPAVGFSPQVLWSDRIIYSPSTADALGKIATMQESKIKANTEKIDELVRQVTRARDLLVSAPVFGIFAAFIAAIWHHLPDLFDAVKNWL